MSSNGLVPQLGEHVPRYLVTRDDAWFEMMARMRRTLANAAMRPRVPRSSGIQKDDYVRTQRDLVVGPHRIARGSVGSVTMIHAHRPLVEVAFFTDPTVCITIAGYELLRAS